jgi:hypothetical protein
MGHYDRFQLKSRQKKPINPIWRGVGCLLIVIVPAISAAVTLVLVPPLEATGMVPLGLLGYLNLPAWMFKVPFLSTLAGFIGGIKNLGLGLVVFFVVLILLAGIFTYFYVAFLQFSGPPRYSEIDAPPPRYKARPYKR